MFSQTITRTQPGQANFAVTQNYEYDGTAVSNSAVDGFNRLSKFTEGTLSQTFGYDVYGNRRLTQGAFPNALTLETPQNDPDFDNDTGGQPRNNRVKGWCYDAAGNLQKIPLTPTQCNGSTLRAMTYDAENRQLSASGMGGIMIYSYDGDGRRVKKASPLGAVTTFIYDAAGQLAQERGGTSDPGLKFLAVDHLGSTRLEMDSAGAPTKCNDYMPFGELLTANRSMACYSATSGNSLEFTGKERDAETGLDYFGARYMSSAQGRFTGPDKPFADQNPTDPQSWNLYGYVRNNPLAHIDSDGRACTALNNSSGYCQRGELYASFDALVYKQTRFFAAASASTQQIVRCSHAVVVRNSRNYRRNEEFPSFN